MQARIAGSEPFGLRSPAEQVEDDGCLPSEGLERQWEPGADAVVTRGRQKCKWSAYRQS